MILRYLIPCQYEAFIYMYSMQHILYIVFLIASINIQNETGDSELKFHDLLNLETKISCPAPLLMYFLIGTFC